MRQAQISHYGGPDVLHVVDDAPLPTPGPEDVLVRIIAAGTNPIDYKIRDGSSGLCAHVTPDDFPLVLGREGCGEVTAVGENVTSIRVGDRVFGMLPMLDFHGTYAEYCAMPAAAVVEAPANVDSTVLAGLSLVGLTAWVAANDQAKVKHEDVVLVQGGAGGVGQVAVQLCVAAGATVYATSRAENRERIESLGARFIDYETQDWTQLVPDPDVIIDTVYFGTYEDDMDHLKPGGRLVLLPTLADLEPARERGINVFVPSIQPSRQRLSDLATAVAQGLVSIEVSDVLPLEQAAEAHRRLEAGHTRGKIILTP